MPHIQFGNSDDSDSDSVLSGANCTDSNLPFPKPLSRSSFLSPTFDPATFLSSLTNRHQTLSDLQTELRELSQSLNNELLDLVNENYQDFLSLGSALRGGEEKVEQVRVGLLGFQRDVKGLRDLFEKRIGEMAELVEEKKKLRKGIMVAHELLDVEYSIGELEESLMIVDGRGEKASGTDDDDEDDSDWIIESEMEESDGGGDGGDAAGSGSDGGGAPTVSLSRLERHIQKYLYIRTISGRVGDSHPFIAQQEGMMGKIKTALLLDLKIALRQAKNRPQRLQAVTRLYELLGGRAQDGDSVETAMQ
ncbi:hypothetical protein PAAG_04285 [Paracoccidioides lutzii Pb01]|uniref:Conserved oligomeric Golgi complex subunit 2 n=1 Tax=Paracoccidioides lutzii (strain ATCC MYA-826 / Pb01) TaxID=502779 RepID=C1H0J1_PARBA|nr:hypothetical protein PAAG_04285 [Paracoccidioides lutzii Pb01]EEH33232.2 hypothetical protein PAAG_04285 [Paracoccidioides lutzii Pb01]